MGDSFKIEDNYNKRKKKVKKNNNLLLIIVFSIIAVICFGGYFIVNIINKNIIYISKEDEEKEYVYTLKQQENPYQDGVIDKVPRINLDGETFDKINQSILSKYEEVSKKVEYDYGYEFNKSKNILSLKITYAYYPNDKAKFAIRYFDTYNIDLRNGNILSDDELLKMYKVTDEQVNNFLEVKFKGFYGDLVNNGFYTEKECDYDCFLTNRGISSNYLNNTSYYIEDGALTLFKYYYIYSEYYEEVYFKNTNYQFIVKK